MATGIPPQLLVGAMRALYELPRPVRALLAGRPVRSEGQRLDLDLQLMLKLSKYEGVTPHTMSPEAARKTIDDAAPLTQGPLIHSVGTREVRIADDLPARLYTPSGLAPGSPLLVFFHGGGFTVGSLDSHDSPCRFLADRAGVRVLSVDYRLAPEHRFPAAAQDAVAAFEYAVEHAEEFGADPRLVAVGGDSAGGNLAAVVCEQTARQGAKGPVFALLFYPVTDCVEERETRRRYAQGYFLTLADITYYTDHYVPDHAQRADPRCSPLRAPDLSGYPPTYIATAGFDPLRDEGEEFAARLRAAGVPVALRRHRELIHAFVNFLGVGDRCREAMAEAAGALRTGFAVAARTHETAGGAATGGSDRATG
jgi:acetyl esterase